MSKILQLFIILIIAVGLGGWDHGVPPVAQIGKFQINLGSGDSAGLYLNFLKAMGGPNNMEGNLPSIFDANQFPTTTPTAGSILYTFIPPACTTADPCIMGWSGYNAFVMSDNPVATSGGDPGGCMHSGYVYGTNCVFTFTATFGNPVTVEFPQQGQGGNTYAFNGTAANAYWIRSSDAAQYAKCVTEVIGNDCFTPEGVAALSVNGIIRPLGMTFPNQSLNNENECQFQYRTPLAAFSWETAQFPPQIWAGAATATANTDQYTVGSYTDMATYAPVWTDGECFQANFASVNSSFPTLNAGLPNSDGGLVELPITANGTLTGATIVGTTLTGTASGTIQAGMYLNDGVDAAGVCLIVSGSAGTYVVSGCSPVATATTMETYTPVANNQQVLVGNTPSQTSPTVYTTNGLVFSPCNTGLACIVLQSSTYSSSWNTGGFVSTATINVGGRGPKFIAGSSGLGAPGLVGGGTNANYTFVYDGLMGNQGLVLFSSLGMQAGISAEVKAALANVLKVPLWDNLAPFWTEAVYHSISAETNYYCTHLNNDLLIQVDDELWNTNFQGTWETERGFALGLTSQVNRGAVGWHIKRALGQVVASWCRPRNQLHIFLDGCLGCQYNPAQNGNLDDTYQFKGTQLCGTSCGNSIYQAKMAAFTGCVGTACDYNVSPNRPGDLVAGSLRDGFIVATYWNGALESGNQGTLVQLQPLINAATEFTAGDTTDAYNFIDGQIRSGVPAGVSSCNGNTNGYGNFNTIACNNSYWLAAWNAEVSLPDEQTGLWPYESGYSDKGQTAAYLNTIGDTGTGSCTGCNGSAIDATQINNLLIAYRSTSQMYNDFIYDFDQLFANNSNIQGDSNLVMLGGGSFVIGEQSWAVLIGNTYIASPLTFYQGYPAIQYLNGL